MTDPSSLPVRQIQAAVLRPNRRQLAIEALELEGPREDEVLVRLVASGICHTDLDFLTDWHDTPVVLGHEGAGSVAEVGRNVTAVKPGDHVVLMP